MSPSGLIAIAGGKLTGYRKMAQRIVDLVLKQFSKTEKRAFKKCQTRKIALNEQPLANAKAVYAYIEELKGRAIPSSSHN